MSENDSYNDRVYKSLLDVETVIEACDDEKGDAEDFIKKVGLFDRTQVAQLLTILNAKLYNDTKILENDVDGETLTTAEDAVIQTLMHLGNFTGDFAPRNWINPLNIDIYTGDTVITGKLDNLIYEISGGDEADNPISTIQDYYKELDPENDEVNTTTPFLGLNVQSLFALALAYNIDPYDSNPSLNIPPPKKAEWLTLSTEVINLVLMLLTLQYVRVKSSSGVVAGEGEHSEEQIVSNFKTLQNAIDTNVSISEIFKNYVNTGEWVISTVVDGSNTSCGTRTPRGDYVLTYQDLLQTFSQLEDDFGNNDDVDAANRANFTTCALLVLEQGLNQLRGLDNSFDVEIPNPPDFLQQVASDGDYDQETSVLQHPVYYLFIFNLIEFITSIEMQLGISPYNYIQDVITNWSTGSTHEKEIKEILNRRLQDSACYNYYDYSTIPTATGISTGTFKMGDSTGDLLGDYQYTLPDDSPQS